MAPALREILETHNLRLTAARSAVYTALDTAVAPLSIQALTAQCPTINRTTVYRVITCFMKLGIVQSVPHGWKWRYELSDALKPHHHHFICKNCGVVIDITSTRLEEALQAAAEKNGAQLLAHHIELSGLCRKCRH